MNADAEPARLPPTEKLANQPPRGGPAVLIFFILGMLFTDVLILPLSQIISHSAGILQWLATALLSAGLLAQLMFISMLGGLYGRVWLVGLFLQSTLVVATGFVFLLGMHKPGSFAESGAFWDNAVSLCLVPAVALANLIPYALMRQCKGWYLTWSDEEFSISSPWSIGQLLISTAAVASVIILAQIPGVFWESSDHLFPLAITCLSVFILAAFFVLPSTALMLLESSLFKPRFVLLCLAPQSFVLLAISVFSTSSQMVIFSSSALVGLGGANLLYLIALRCLSYTGMRLAVARPIPEMLSHLGVPASGHVLSSLDSQDNETRRQLQRRRDQRLQEVLAVILFLISLLANLVAHSLQASRLARPQGPIQFKNPQK